MGQAWWDIERQNVYKSNNYCCIACGISKLEAKKHKWLEAHEYWKICYETGICEITSIEPLCHYCHNFIHSGRLSMIVGKEKTKQEVIDILEHGFLILSKNNLKCFPFTLDLANKLGAKTYNVKSYIVKENRSVKWTDWVLLWNNQEFRSKFKSYEDWLNFYKKKIKNYEKQKNN